MENEQKRTTLIKTENLSFSYSRNLVFSHVGFTIHEGDFVAVIGANGTGKSTLVKMILGQLPPASGSIELFGKDRKNFHDWWRIGYLPQGQAFTAQSFPATARELVQTGLFPHVGLMRFLHRGHHARVHQALERVGMAQMANRLVGHMSGGQQQRVMLARVLVAEPQLMILDEPASGIDEQSASSLFSLLGDLNRDQHLTILMITHDIVRVAPYLNRVFCLESGSMIELSHGQLTEELRHRHEHPVNPDCICCGPEGEA